MKRALLLALCLAALPASVADAAWIIQRADLSYRACNANTKDDALLAGESWVFIAGDCSVVTIVVPLGPDVPGFIGDCIVFFGVVPFNAFVSKYPMIVESLRRGRYADARALLDNAVTTLSLSSANRDTVVGLGVSRRLPGW